MVFNCPSPFGSSYKTNKTFTYFCYKREINIGADTKTGAKFLESGRQVAIVNTAHELVPIPHQQAFNFKKQCT